MKALLTSLAAGLVLVGALLAPSCGSLPLEENPADGGGLPPDRFHPLNFALPEKHGPATNLQKLDCRGCHAGDLTGIGGVPVSCDTCHQAGWRTNCTYCHGGVDNDLGAPPRDLDGTRERSATKFPGHSAHVSDTASHAKFDCDQCHVKPRDVLTPDHVFDGTPGAAELVFTKGLSPAGTYEGGTCANVYCHGNGRSGSGGTIAAKADPVTCAGCHGSQSETATWRTFSGLHSRHLGSGVGCTECHATVVGSGGEDILEPSLHVNGVIEIAFGTGAMTRSTAGRCTGTCHGTNHLAASWGGN